jgi:hypothetical protein
MHRPCTSARGRHGLSEVDHCLELLGEVGVLDLHLVRGTPEGVPRIQNLYATWCDYAIVGRIWRSRRTRSSIGGWVENSAAIPPPLKGLTM